MSLDTQFAGPQFAGPRPSRSKEAIPSSVLGTIVFILTEMMFFASLVSAYMIISAGAEAWPPPDQPRLPVTATAINSLFLLASGLTMYLAYKAQNMAKRGNLLRITIVLGMVFVAAQGLEWVRLVGHGLTVTSDVYGSFFYVIIGAHGIHAIGALAAMVRLFLRFRKGKASDDSFLGHSIFWYFVVGIWPILYTLVYL